MSKTPTLPADAAERGVADKVVVLALAGRVAVLAPVTLGAELLAARAGVAGAALAAAVHRVARGLVVAVALKRVRKSKLRRLLSNLKQN